MSLPKELMQSEYKQAQLKFESSSLILLSVLVIIMLPSPLKFMTLTISFILDLLCIIVWLSQFIERVLLY